MEMVEVDGLHIAYERAGSGPALVLLQGYVRDGPTTLRRRYGGVAAAWRELSPVPSPFDSVT